MPDISGDQLRGHLETLILSILQRSPAHGLEILRRLDSAGHGSLKLREGSLYPALYRLEESGLLKAKWEEETKGRRAARRRIYQLTPRGKSALSAGRAQWKTFSRVISSIMGVPA